MMNLGDFTTSETIYVPFATYDSNGASVTITGLAVTDIEIYKDGSVTQRSSDAGYTLLDTDGIDFDSTTGLHGFSIDLSDNTDAGFYADGSTYWIVVNSITVDSQTVVAVFYFRIYTPAVDVAKISGDSTAADNLELDYDGTGYAKANSTMGTVTALTGHTAQTGDSFARIGATGSGLTSLAQASVLGALADAAAAGDPTASDTLVAYVKQLINTLEGTTGIPVYPASADPANNVSLAEAIRAIRDDVTGLAGAAMRGTDNAALASVVGALADAAAAGDPTSADTLMQYAKQLVNVLVGTAGIGTWPAAAAPANTVSIAEALRAVYDDTNELQTDDIPSLLPAALVGGRMDSSVGAMAAGVVTAAAIATDAIGSDEFAASAAQKIRDEIMPTQNAAFNNIEFLFVAASDHVTPVTGATGTAVTRSIDGGAFGSGTGTLAEVGNGIYQYDASAADMNGGIITFRFTGTGGTPGAPDDAFVTIVTGGGV